jgi:hypothetical protein
VGVLEGSNGEAPCCSDSRTRLSLSHSKGCCCSAFHPAPGPRLLPCPALPIGIHAAGFATDLQAPATPGCPGCGRARAQSFAFSTRIFHPRLQYMLQVTPVLIPLQILIRQQMLAGGCWLSSSMVPTGTSPACHDTPYGPAAPVSKPLK